jgi:hypothetical protein
MGIRGGLWFPASVCANQDQFRVYTSLLDRIMDGKPRVNIGLDLSKVVSIDATRGRFGWRLDLQVNTVLLAPTHMPFRNPVGNYLPAQPSAASHYLQRQPPHQ